MMSLEAAARALSGDIRNGQVVCPGPGHSPRDRSLAVRFNAGGGYVVHSFAGDDPMDCRDHVDRLRTAGVAQVWSADSIEPFDGQPTGRSAARTYRS
jgi:hypothetical protein